METLIAFTVGFTAALFYSKGKADPVRSFTIDAKRVCRWTRDRFRETKTPEGK